MTEIRFPLSWLDAKREEIEAARAAHRYVAAINAEREAVYFLIHLVLELEGVDAEYRPDFVWSFSELDAFAARVELAVKAAEDPNARNWIDACFAAISTLRDIHAVLEVHGVLKGFQDEHTARAMFEAARLGLIYWLLNMRATGAWANWFDAVSLRQRIGDGPRGRIPDWEKNFAPAANEFCQRKGSVSKGKLTQEARAWADRERAAGRRPSLPATDKGIGVGLVRMKDRGALPAWKWEGKASVGCESL